MTDRKGKKQRAAEDENEKASRRARGDTVDSWVKDQYEHQKSSPHIDSDRYEGDSNMDQDDPTDQDHDDGSLIEGGSRKSAFQYSKEVYDMKCEWADCDYESMTVDNFVHHVGGHMPHTEQRDTATLFCCLWDSCGFDSDNWNIILRHINYHSYHTKIKAIGSAIVKRLKLPDCALDYAGRNLLPVLPSGLVCEWDNCDFSSNNFQLFIYHVQCHVHTLPRRKHMVELKKALCEWRGCKKTFTNNHKLRDHLRTHTQEKMVGCPVCGTQFSSKTKFYDHCKRQTADDKKGFKCSHCRKSFATERILRDHIRLHVNMYKCPLCDMTCPFPSTLALHIRYRHLDQKPFKCNFCDHRSTVQRDLENHQLTHCSENFWVCEQEDCDYTCRSKNVLQEHYLKNHANIEPCQYCCHICSNRYKRGADLTVHLKNEHSYRWASGHSRFKYIREEDGFYRLQTVRYESIEVTKEMMKTKVSKTDPVPKKRLKCTFESPLNIVFQEEEAEEEEAELLQKNGSKEGPSQGESKKPDLVSLDDGSESSDSSNFGETLKNYLGLTGTSNFIKVVKNNMD